jgi:hypothetical protein
VGTLLGVDLLEACPAAAAPEMAQCALPLTLEGSSAGLAHVFRPVSLAVVDGIASGLVLLGIVPLYAAGSGRAVDTFPAGPEQAVPLCAASPEQAEQAVPLGAAGPVRSAAVCVPVPEMAQGVPLLA